MLAKQICSHVCSVKIQNIRTFFYYNKKYTKIGNFVSKNSVLSNYSLSETCQD